MNFSGFSRDLIDLVNIDDAVLRSVQHHRLQPGSLSDRIFSTSSPTYPASVNAVASAIANGTFQNLCQRLCQQRLSAAGRSEHQNITLLEFHTEILSRHDPLIMIIYCNGKNFFGLVLTDHIIVQKCFDLFRGQKIDIFKPVPLFVFKFFLNDLCADIYTFVTDIRPVRSCNQFAYLRLWFITERTSYCISSVSFPAILVSLSTIHSCL